MQNLATLLTLLAILGSWPAAALENAPQVVETGEPNEGEPDEGGTNDEEGRP